MAQQLDERAGWVQQRAAAALTGSIVERRLRLGRHTARPTHSTPCPPQHAAQPKIAARDPKPAIAAWLKQGRSPEEICKHLGYCGTECQKADWKKHKKLCTRL